MGWQSIHWKITVSQRLSPRSERREPHVGVPSLTRLAGLEGRSPTGLGETENPLLEGTCKLPCALGARLKGGLHENLGQTSLQDFHLEKQKSAVACCEVKDTDSGGPREYWHDLLPFWHQDQVPPKSLQAPMLGSLRANNEQSGNKTNPSADMLPKVAEPTTASKYTP